MCCTLEGRARKEECPIRDPMCEVVMMIDAAPRDFTTLMRAQRLHDAAGAALNKLIAEVVLTKHEARQ